MKPPWKATACRLPNWKLRIKGIQEQTIPVLGPDRFGLPCVYRPAVGSLTIIGTLNIPDSFTRSQFDNRIILAPGRDKITETINGLSSFHLGRSQDCLEPRQISPDFGNERYFAEVPALLNLDGYGISFLEPAALHHPQGLSELVCAGSPITAPDALQKRQNLVDGTAF